MNNRRMQFLHTPVFVFNEPYPNIFASSKHHKDIQKMRAENEINADEYAQLKKEMDAEVSGRKNKAIVKVDEFSGEGEKPSLHKKSRIFRKLHRLHLSKDSTRPA